MPADEKPSFFDNLPFFKGDKEERGSAELRDDFEKRSLEFRINCDDGNGDESACHSLGEWHAVVEQKYEDAAHVYRKNCEKNCYAASCFNLARLHLAGKGVEQDDEAAARLLHKSCEGGHIAGCSHLAHMCFAGAGVPRDPQRGARLLEKSCTLGGMGSCAKLGSLLLVHHEKYGLSRDTDKALKLFARACDNGWAPACHTLAVMYKQGDGVPQSDEKYQQYRALTQKLVEKTGRVGTRTTRAG